MIQSSKTFTLEERTSKFGENIIRFSKTLKQDTISTPVISQFIRAATSIGANYMEANNASSKKDFQNKIYICKKETQETKYWLRMLAECFPERKDEIRVLWKETHEFNLIFQKITSSLKINK